MLTLFRLFGSRGSRYLLFRPSCSFGLFLGEYDAAVRPQNSRQYEPIHRDMSQKFARHLLVFSGKACESPMLTGEMAGGNHFNCPSIMEERTQPSKCIGRDLLVMPIILACFPSEVSGPLPVPCAYRHLLWV